MDADTSWATVALILTVAVGCILAVFLAYLVRTAYDMRIGLKAQMDRGLRAVEEEANKRARALRQELGGDIDRARSNMFDEARRRLSDALASLESRQLDMEKASRQERVEVTMTLDALRDEMAALRQRIDDLERELLLGGAEEIAPEYSLGGAITPSATVVAPQGSAGPMPASRSAPSR
jgi:hypothetical protein